MLVILLMTFVVMGCEIQSELSDSIYIPDEEYPELPAYTEWGYNTFGANYDRSVFKYSHDEVPLKVVSENDTISFIFQGMNGTYYGDYMAMRFRIPDSGTDDYRELLEYNDSIIDLAGGGVIVELITRSFTRAVTILEGEIYFKRSQRVFVDDVEQQVILSGFFELKFLMNDIPSGMSNGRFDFGINEENFYSLQ